MLWKVEIDLSKAFAYQLMNMNYAVVFNQFDNLQYFNDSIDINTLPDLTLYFVEAKFGIPHRTRMLFNQTYNLIYGNLLKTNN